MQISLLGRTNHPREEEAGGGCRRRKQEEEAGGGGRRRRQQEEAARRQPGARKGNETEAFCYVVKTAYDFT